MIIANSSMRMESFRTSTSVRMDANYVTTGGDNNFSFKEAMGSLNTKRLDRTQETQEDEMRAIEKIRQQCMMFLLRLLFGNRQYDFYNQNGLYSPFVTGSAPSSVNEIHYRYEEEHTEFDTTGTVITADGRKLDINLNVEMSRSFEEYYTQSHELPVNLCDPLVINLDTSVAEVCDEKFRFDLDCDGTNEQICRLSSQSGYLAIDLNKDGIINDGNELFGTKSGDGFKDLAAYDSDRNGWIDEADDVWKDLKILVQNNDGTDNLYSLSDKNIGAIYLGNVRTDFTQKNLMTGATDAVIRSTGLFLYEDGSAGTIQHIDLAG